MPGLAALRVDFLSFLGIPKGLLDKRLVRGNPSTLKHSMIECARLHARPSPCEFQTSPKKPHLRKRCGRVNPYSVCFSLKPNKSDPCTGVNFGIVKFNQNVNHNEKHTVCFAEAEEYPTNLEESSLEYSTQRKDGRDSKFNGMAEALQIRPITAASIIILIAFCALLLPYIMQAVFIPGSSLKNQVLTYFTLLCGFYMAWNIGANDVANAMGTSVGSGALTLRQAVVTAAILEFAGAFLVGSHVSDTMKNGILVGESFSSSPTLLFCGMLSSLAAAGTWLQVASFYGWPVSTTHCIIGALVGFGLFYGGIDSIQWVSLARVVSSWLISPLCGAAVSFFVYKCIRIFVYSAPNPGEAAAKSAPIAVFVGVFALSFTSLFATSNAIIALLQSFGFASVSAFAIRIIVQQQLGTLIGESCPLPEKVATAEQQNTESLLSGYTPGPTGTQLRLVYGVFSYLQILSACFMSFAHGANDVANAIGPIFAALSILNAESIASFQGSATLSNFILAWGGFGIVAGLLVWGYRVIATIGKKITELTPTRGFAAEFAAATVVVVASRLGLPISATHTLVGAVMGVGLARGLNSVRGSVVKEIVASWMVTIPIGAMLSIGYAQLFVKFIPIL